MEVKSTPIFGSCFFFFLISVSICAGFEYQTLNLRALPEPQTLRPDLQWSESETVISPEISETAAGTTRLSLRLEHIDALASNATAEELFKLRLHRDARRVHRLSTIAAGEMEAASSGRKDFSGTIISGLAQGSGEYFTRLGIGTPPLYNYLVLDTGSDINWIQCARCQKCYRQVDRIFNPKRSATFKSVSCESPLCRMLDSPGCSADKTKCLYEVSYGDGSFTAGELASETLTFRRTKVASVPIGCGHDNEGLFVGAAGLLGLGRGKLSFPSQVGDRFNRKFSYCLVDRSATSKPSALLFGESAVSRRAVFTPLIVNPKVDTFYYLGLTAFSVGGSRVRGISAANFRLDGIGNGGVIIDSGTSVTRLARPAYEALRDAFLRATGALRLKPAAGFSLFDTCYDLSGRSEVKVPTVAMHFGGVEVALPASNYLIPVDTRGTFCFAFAPTEGGLSIIGNIQQQGIRVVFDLAGSRVGFAPNSCA